MQSINNDCYLFNGVYGQSLNLHKLYYRKFGFKWRILAVDISISLQDYLLELTRYNNFNDLIYT